MEKHHSCLITKAIIDYFQAHAPEQVPALMVGLGPEIEGLPRPLDFLREANNWVSSPVVMQMFENARQLAGDERVAFKIGFEAVTRKKLGYVQRIFFHIFGSPRRALKKVQILNNKFNRTKVVEIPFLKGNQVTIRFHWLSHIPASKDFCRFNQGVYSAIPTIWELSPGVMKETRCYFEGADYCEFEGTWQDRARLQRRLVKMFMPWRLLRTTVEELEKDKELLKQKFDEVHHLNLQLRERIDQLLALPETCVAALAAVDLQGLLQVTLRILVNFAKMDRAGIFILDEESQMLELHSGVGIDPALEEKVKGYKIPMAKVDNIIARVAVNGVPVVVSDVTHSHLNKENPLLRIFQPQAFILAPITIRGRVIGVILADRVRKDSTITEVDKEFVVNFANQIAIALDNALLQRKLEVSERRYRELVENAFEGIWMVDEGGSIKFVNRRLREIIGTTDLEGHQAENFFEGDHRKMLAGMWAENRKGRAVQQELEIISRDRGPVPVIVSSVPFMEQDHFLGAFAMFNDVSDLKKMEKHLLQQAKTEALGTMAEGLGHSFSDLLANIMILAGMVLDNTDRSHPNYDELKQIEQELAKGAELTRRLLSFGRGQRFSLKPLDLTVLIEKTLNLLAISHQGLVVQKNLTPDLPPVDADQEQLEQVLTHLVIQARDNLAPGGEVTLGTEEVVLHEEFCRPYGRMPGRYVYLALSYPERSGAASPGAIFEPFFAGGVPAALEQGSGLGLTSVYAIIKDHKGIVEVDRDPGGSTSFHIYLPLGKGTPEATEGQPYHFVKGSGTLLLVDDDDTVRQMGAKILERLGYRVIRAEDGRQAVSIYQAQEGRINLVLLDMILPGMSGRETYRQLKKIDPEVKVLLYSGRAMDEDVHLVLEDGALGFIQKPYRMAALSEKIAEILHGQRPGQNGPAPRERKLAGAV